MTARLNNEIAYEVIRSQRATADIVIERDGNVVVRAPEWADDDQVARIVQSKEYWIYKTLAEWRDLNAAAVLREYKNGAAFLYVGRAYRLSLLDGQEEPLQLKNGRFLLRRELVAAGDARPAKSASQEFFREKGRLRLGDRVRYYAPKVGVEPLGVEVKELGHRWASCSPGGKLHFHWKCMMAPQTVIDYIVVHELCHLHHRDHTDAFWNEVDKVLPDFRERKEWLRR